MPRLTKHFDLTACPHCNVNTPLLSKVHEFHTDNHSSTNQRHWRVYVCASCGGVVTAWADNLDSTATQWFPDAETVNEDLPERAQAYLQQAINSKHAPSGAVMLAASAVDAMLKSKDYREGNLYGRIDQAAEDGVITEGMAAWAHEIRLDANDQRHADEDAALPLPDDAIRCIDFATALGQFLFVLPARIRRGRKDASGEPKDGQQQ